MNTGFIGAGNMAGALIRGFVEAGVKAESLFAYNRSPEKTEKLKAQCGINMGLSYEDILNNCNIVILAVKPHLIKGVLNDIRGLINKDKHTLVSIAAGTSVEMLESFAHVSHMPVIRVMPNVNVTVREGITALCSNQFVSKEVYDYVYSLFEKVGKMAELEEKFFPIFGALAGSSPAFSYLFIESLAKAAHKAGMPKAQAVEIAAQAVLGSAKMLLNSDKHPWELADMVCSPGGTTIEGICSLEESGFASAVVKCLDACMDKDRVIMGRNGNN